MDSDSTASLVVGAYAVLHPYLPIIATKAAEKLGEQLPTAVANLWKFLRKRLTAKPDAEVALNMLLDAPEDVTKQTGFQLELRKILEQDPRFAVELERMVNDVSPRTYFDATLHGSGAIAQGPGATAAGADSILIHNSPDGEDSGKA